MPFPALIPIWDTGNENQGLKHEHLELLIETTNYHPLDVQCLYCISDNVFNTEALNNNVLEASRTDMRGEEDLGFCTAKVINIQNSAFLSEKKIIANKQMTTPRLHHHEWSLLNSTKFHIARHNAIVLTFLVELTIDTNDI